MDDAHGYKESAFCTLRDSMTWMELEGLPRDHMWQGICHLIRQYIGSSDVSLNPLLACKLSVCFTSM